MMNLHNHLSFQEFLLQALSWLMLLFLVTGILLSMFLDNSFISRSLLLNTFCQNLMLRSLYLNMEGEYSINTNIHIEINLILKYNH